MNAPRFRVFLTLAFSLWVWHCHAQGALEQLQRAEKLLQTGQNQQALTLMTGAMEEARSNKETALFLRAANDIARMGLTRKVPTDKAFSLTREAVRRVAYSPTDTSLASLYYQLARYHDNAYETDEAIKWYAQAAGIFEKNPGSALRAAQCYHGLADVYKYTVFNFQLAEELYERALRIREKAQLKDTVTLFNNYYGLAVTNRSQHDYEKAMSYGTVAITLSQALNTVRQEFARSMIANIYRDMGHTEEAIQSYKEALRLNEITRNDEAKASHLNNLAETLRDDSLFDDALRYYKMAGRIFRSLDERDERLFQNSLIGMATTYMAVGDEANATLVVSELRKALEQTGRTRSWEAAESLLLLADINAREQRYYSALDQCQKALTSYIPRFNSLKLEDNPTFSMIGTNYYAGIILAKKGEYLTQVYRASGQNRYLEQALKSLYLAEQLLSEERNALDTEEAKWAFLDTKYTVYENIISLLHESWKKTGSDEARDLAYQYFEQSKARSLTDALAVAEQARLLGADDSLLLVHRKLKAEQFATENRISDLESAGSDLDRVARLREHLVKLDRQLQLCADAIEQAHPGYFNARYGHALLSLPELQALARDKNRVFIEYFWGADWVYGLGISSDTVVINKLGRADSIGRLIDKLLTHFKDEHSSASLEMFVSFVTSSHALYTLLVKPFAPMLGDASLQIIPDGAVNQVPFDILLWELPSTAKIDYRNLSYLLKSQSIGYAYSTSMLRYTGRSLVEHPTMLAVGFTGAASADMDALQEIEGAEKELDALSSRFHEGKFLRGQQATESNFKSLAPDFDLIHLAIHGRGDRRDNFAASLFFRSINDATDDGIFHAYELYGLKLKASMAVLSACESGIGRNYQGEGMISMASAFTSAGCENTLMSLWKVNDQAAITLMDDFYAHLFKGQPIGEALRAAKLKYLSSADEITADPKTWAPLVAYGNLHQVFDADRRRPYLLLMLVGVAIIIVGIVIYINRRRNRYSVGGLRSPL